MYVCHIQVNYTLQTLTKMEDSYIDNYDHVNESILYTPVNIPGKGCDLSLFDSRISSCCSCHNECSDPVICSCLETRGINYINRKLVDLKLEGSGSCIECNSLCRCSSVCENRVVQFGPASNLKIEAFGNKGYGLISTTALQKGQFVCEYAGEVIGRSEANERRKRDSHNYIFVLNEFIKNDVIETIVDATCIGNIARYINHSCEPNCNVIPVRVDSLVPKLAIFANRDIPVCEEITYSYGRGVKAIGFRAERNLCLCGAKQCQKFLPCDL